MIYVYENPLGFGKDSCKAFKKSLQDIYAGSCIVRFLQTSKMKIDSKKFFSKLSWSHTLLWTIRYFLSEYFRNVFSSEHPRRAPSAKEIKVKEFLKQSLLFFFCKNNFFFNQRELYWTNLNILKNSFLKDWRYGGGSTTAATYKMEHSVTTVHDCQPLKTIFTTNSVLYVDSLQVFKKKTQIFLYE